MSLARKENFDASVIDPNVYSALKNSIYPGASDESIAMVHAYCVARKLDPFLKPVHIVKMKVKNGKMKKSSKGFEYEDSDDRDVIMNGIGLYRIQADRTGLYAGQTEPEFGPEVTEKFDGKEFTYPQWAKVTVLKIMPDGSIAKFTAKEFWIENYATSGKDKKFPNAMWAKRKYGQIAKCAEAQALRKAFPDSISHGPIAEEMEGKHVEPDYIDVEVENPEQKLNKTLPKPAYDMSQLCKSLNESRTVNDLENNFINATRIAKGNQDHVNVLIELKDKLKSEFYPSGEEKNQASEQTPDNSALDKSWDDFKEDKL